MSHGTEYTEVVLLSSLSKDTLGQKVRLVARVLYTAPNSSLVWIEDSGSYALVDISILLASNNSMLELFRQPRCHVMVTGYVEALETQEEIPACPVVSKFKTSAPLVLRVVLLQSVPNIDMNNWRRSVLARQELIERARQLRTPQRAD